MEGNCINDIELVHILRYSISNDQRNLALLARKIISRLKKERPDLAEQIGENIPKPAPTREYLIKEDHAVYLDKPVDIDTRQSLVIEEYPANCPVAPIWSQHLSREFEQVIAEFRSINILRDAGLTPTRTMLFYGPPGVGKTLAARWLATQLDLPLLILDLASVMSSYLGRTGYNLRAVLEHASARSCVLLLDEFDAIAKRRDDIGEIGELKRLVNVLLQSVDQWKAGKLLIAATNHSELLDPAVWRRFDKIIEFPMPEPELIRQALLTFISPTLVKDWADILSVVFKGHSFDDIVKAVDNAKRRSITQSISLDEVFIETIHDHSKRLDKESRINVGLALMKSHDLSQRRVQELLGVSRDTLRTRMRSDTNL